MHVHRPAAHLGLGRQLHHQIALCEIDPLLTHQVALPEYADLRPARQAKNITVTGAAIAFSIWPTVICHIELGQRRDDDLANRYRTWHQGG